MAERILDHHDGGPPRQGARRSPTGAARNAWSGALLAALHRAARHCSYGLTRKFSLFLAGLLTAMTGTLTAVSTLAEQHVTEQRLRQRVEDSVTLLADLAATIWPGPSATS